MPTGYGGNEKNDKLRSIELYLKFYLRRGVVYMPTSSETEAGFYIQTAPVAIVKVSDSKEFGEALKRFIAAGNPKIPTPKPEAFPKPDLHKYAKVSSWSKFERESSYWSLRFDNGASAFGPYRRRQDRGWEPDFEKIENFPAEFSMDDAVSRIVGTVQAFAAEAGGGAH